MRVNDGWYINLVILVASCVLMVHRCDAFVLQHQPNKALSAWNRIRNECPTKLYVKNLIRGDNLAELGVGKTESPRIRRNRAYTQSTSAASNPSVSSSTTSTTTSNQKRIIPQGQPRLQELNNPNKLRILGGRAKGRKIDSPNVYLRPMMAKVREAVFSTLTFLNVFAPERETRVLDIFAGAGSVGLESLSRGAVHATFVDMASECTNTVLRNGQKCGFSTENQKSREAEVKVVTARAEDILSSPAQYGVTEPFHFVSLTPPYQEVSYPQLLSLLCTTPLLMEDSIVMIEYPFEMGTLPPTVGEEKELIGLRNRRYGRTVLAMYVFRPSRHYDIRPEEFQDDHVRRS